MDERDKLCCVDRLCLISLKSVIDNVFRCLRRTYVLQGKLGLHTSEVLLLLREQLAVELL